MIVEKPYTVAIPVPFLDSEGNPLPAEDTELWVKKTLDELTSCFGGATPVPAAGTNVLKGQIVYEKGQVLVLSGCDSQEQYLGYRNRLKSFAEVMRQELRQHAVFVLACPSDSFLVVASARPEGSP